MTYIDGFVAAVPTANREQYRVHAKKAAQAFKEHGALKVVECWGDDVPSGTTTDFRMAVKAEEDEEVLFSWIEWPDKATRDAGWEKIMGMPELQPQGDMPFDGKRMFWGGFVPIVDRGR